MSNKRLRQTVRSVHLVVGVMLGFFVYSPLREVGWYVLTVQALAIPLILLSGLTLWQQPKLSSWLKKRSS